MPPRRAPLRRVSKKRAATNVVRRANVRAVFGQRPVCQACGPLALVGVSRTVTGCWGWADDAHELLSRARGGSITDPTNILPVSRACHTWLTTHPDLAEAAGLSLPSRGPSQPRCLP